MVLWVNGKGLTPGQNNHKGTHPRRNHIFGYIERKSTFLSMSCGCVQRTKNGSKQGYKYSHLSTPPCIAMTTVFGIRDRNQSYNILSNRFRDFGAPSQGWRKWLLHCLGLPPFQQCTQYYASHKSGRSGLAVAYVTAVREVLESNRAVGSCVYRTTTAIYSLVHGLCDPSCSA